MRGALLLALQLLAGAAVYWVGARVSFAPSGNVVTATESPPRDPRCR